MSTNMLIDVFVVIDIKMKNRKNMSVHFVKHCSITFRIHHSPQLEIRNIGLVVTTFVRDFGRKIS